MGVPASTCSREPFTRRSPCVYSPRYSTSYVLPSANLVQLGTCLTATPPLQDMWTLAMVPRAHHTSPGSSCNPVCATPTILDGQTEGGPCLTSVDFQALLLEGLDFHMAKGFIASPHHG